MRHLKLLRPAIVAALAALTVLAAGPGDALAQTVAGKANAVRVTTLGLLGGTTTVLAGTGALGGTTDARDAALVTGSVPSVLTGEVLRAVTIGWPDQVSSEASLADLALTIGSVGVTADFVMSRASSALGGGRGGSSLIENLSIGGVPVHVTGQPNQTVWIPAGKVVINEQTVSGGVATVNALHAVVPGVIDVVVASATAGIQ